MKLAILSSGGDCPGMNMVIWSLFEYAKQEDIDCVGVKQGLQGLIDNTFTPLEEKSLRAFARRGGSSLGTSRVQDFPDKMSQVLSNLKQEAIDAVVVIGGNGSLQAAQALSKELLVAYLPGTIDNDVKDSHKSIGFDTALNSALNVADGIMDSAEALGHFFSLITLGGSSGFIANAVAKASCADVLLIPEKNTDFDTALKTLKQANEQKGYSLLVAAEGYPELEITLENLASALNTKSRISRLGHAQRGGAPTAFDRLLARALAKKAIQGLIARQSGCAMWQAEQAVYLSFEGMQELRLSS